tara:strand:- start:469 stop:729 length:261 start_codon:yes stop_codon:yes gene_type:complete
MPSKAKKLNVYRKNHQQGYHNRLRGIRFKASPELSIDQEQLKIAEFLGKGLGKKYPRGATLDPHFQEDAKCQSLLNAATTIELKDG